MKQITFPLSHGIGKLPGIRIARSYGSSIFIYISFEVQKDNVVRVSGKTSDRQAACHSTCLEEYGEGN